MGISRALAACALLFLGCAKAPSIAAKSGASARPLTAEQEAFRRLLAQGCTGFKECDDLYIKTRRRAAECSEISSDCSREREDLAVATTIRDEGFDRATREDYRQRFVLYGERFRNLFTLDCPELLVCELRVLEAHSRVTECAELGLDCTRDRENEIAATAQRDAERQCQATPACIGPRLAKEICEAKEETPEDDDVIAPLLKRYAAATRKPFNDKLCGSTKLH